MLDQSQAGTTIPATVLTAGFQAQCTFSVMGMLQTFLNDDQKGVFTLHDVTLFGLEQGNPARSITTRDLFIGKQQCHLIAFQEIMSQEQTGLMPRIERLAVYTSHYVIQGDFHMGSDARPSDFIDTSRSQFVAATDVHIFPLFPAQTQVIQHAPLAYLHRTQARMHHPAAR